MLNLIDILLEFTFVPLYGITVVVALWRYPRYFDSIFKYLPVLLTYNFLNEVLGAIIKYYDEFDFVFKDVLTYNNWIIYNIYDIIFYLYFFYVYWLSTDQTKTKKFIIIGTSLFIAAAIVNPFIADFATRFQMLSYFTGALVLIATILMYFQYTKIKTGKWFTKKNLVSWLSLGILIFLAGYIPLIVLGHFEIVPRENYQIIRRLHLLLIITMYGCFIAGFLKMSKKQIV